MLVSGLNRNGMVGKRFMIHNYNWFSGTLPEETHVYAGPASAGWAIDDTSGDTIDRSNLNFVGGTPVMFFGGDVQPIEAASVLMPPDVPMRARRTRSGSATATGASSGCTRRWPLCRGKQTTSTSIRR